MKRLGATLLVLVIIAASVVAFIALAIGGVELLKRGAGTHLEDEPSPSVTISDDAPVPLRPDTTPAP